jgi:Cdc6-like AAA superfamily ATPase
VALEFCAKKVSGYSGDIRRAFYICQKAKQIQEEQETSNEVTVGSTHRSDTQNDMVENR